MDSALHRFHSVTALRRHARAAACLTLTLVLAFGVALPAQGQVMEDRHTVRELSGLITDPGHEPIRGAVVQLEADNTHEILTYITEADGHYRFKHLSGEQDYRVWVVFRKRHSKTREISKFDDHMDKVINFTIEVF